MFESIFVIGYFNIENTWMIQEVVRTQLYFSNQSRFI